MLLQISCFSTFDKTVYSCDEIVAIARKCKNAGASTLHFHIEKVGDARDFLRVAQKLDEEKIGLSVSSQDFKKILLNSCVFPKSIKYVAMHASDCKIFTTQIKQTFCMAEQQLQDYTKLGVIPEVHMFNQKGIENCLVLAEKYGYNFLPIVNMGYPCEMRITHELIEEIMNRLNKFSQIVFVLFDNDNPSYYNLILKHRKGIRIGLEDNGHCGTIRATNCVDCAKYISGLMEKASL